MKEFINVIIDTETGQVIAIQMNDGYIVSPSLFDNNAGEHRTNKFYNAGLNIKKVQ